MLTTHVYAADTAFLSDPERFAAAYLTVDTARREKIDRAATEQAKRLSLGAGLLLRAALALHGVTEIAFHVGEKGKPLLQHPTVRFNLSHSGDKVLCAVSSAEVGCDIERLGKPRLSVAQRRFHPTEYAALTQCTDRDAQTLFYRLWTVKESLLKYSGEGLSGGLSSFAVGFDGDRPFLLEGRFDTALHLRSFMLDGYCAAVCAQTPIEDLQWVTL